MSNNNIDIDDLTKLDALLSFTISGIETHMKEDEINPEMITNALLNISTQLHEIIVNA